MAQTSVFVLGRNVLSPGIIRPATSALVAPAKKRWELGVLSQPCLNRIGVWLACSVGGGLEAPMSLTSGGAVLPVLCWERGLFLVEPIGRRLVPASPAYLVWVSPQTV